MQLRERKNFPLFLKNGCKNISCNILKSHPVVNTNNTNSSAMYRNRVLLNHSNHHHYQDLFLINYEIIWQQLDGPVSWKNSKELNFSTQDTPGISETHKKKQIWKRTYFNFWHLRAVLKKQIYQFFKYSA